MEYWALAVENPKIQRKKEKIKNFKRGSVIALVAMEEGAEEFPREVSVSESKRTDFDFRNRIR